MLRQFTQASLVLLFFFVSPLAVDFNARAATNSRPFWTEKSAYVEGDDLYVVGVASNVRTVEVGRLKAFEHGKIELMNFAQVTDLEAHGLVVETQMTYEEQNSDGTVTVFRLLRVYLPKLLEIQRARAAKLDQQQTEVTQLLNRLSGQSAHSQSLTERLKATESLLEKREAEMEAVSRLARERLNKEKEFMKKRCSLLVIGMTRDEVLFIMGPPRQSFLDKIERPLTPTVRADEAKEFFDRLTAMGALTPDQPKKEPPFGHGTGVERIEEEPIIKGQTIVGKPSLPGQDSHLAELKSKRWYYDRTWSYGTERLKVDLKFDSAGELIAIQPGGLFASFETCN